MNFVAGALLLACSMRDPTINVRAPKRAEPSPSSSSSTTIASRRNHGGAGAENDSAFDGRNNIEGVVAVNAIAENQGGEVWATEGERESRDLPKPDARSEAIPRIEGGDALAAAAATTSGSLSSSALSEKQQKESLTAAVTAAEASDSGNSGGEEDDAPPKEWTSGPQHSRAEEDVFWLMMALTSRLPDVGSGLVMRELWLPGVPQLKASVFAVYVNITYIAYMQAYTYARHQGCRFCIRFSLV